MVAGLVSRLRCGCCCLLSRADSYSEELACDQSMSVEALEVLLFPFDNCYISNIFVPITSVTSMRKAFRISPAEWEVMSVVWEQSPVDATTVAELLERKKKWTLATVRTLLRRLANKGALAYRIEGKKYVYTALVTMEDCVRQESESFLARVVGRAPAATLLHLVRKADLSAADIAELRRVLRQKQE